ncbi:hypothetical protein NNO04_22500, partial [Citrobacter sp. Awk 4]|nr:hypothetical protein [Citrobacter sp. Awk 4]
MADKSDIRKDDFYKGDMRFEYVFINKGAFEQRSRLSGLLKIIKILSSIKYKKLVFPGWEIKELCLLSLLTTKRKNCVAVESSILETERSLLKWMLKKLFLKRMATGLPSGHLQAEIFHEMNFSGELVYTNGVGVLNEKFYCQSGQSIHCLIGSKNIKYIYVGRIADEKNLELLCKVMTETDKYLTIVGYGPKETELIEKYGHAVNFLGSID